MKSDPDKMQDFPFDEQRFYPHLKITDEEFPRLLVTRKIHDDGAEYFGAFLPETGVRFFIDFLNKLFKLRTCTIRIDGDFSVPCPQFYAKRCLAPCVENLCDKEKYLETIELLRLFLRREREVLKNKITAKIENFAEELDFETAGEWRDFLEKTEEFWQTNEWLLWLDEAKDSWRIERERGKIFVYLVTMRGRKTLGKRVFVFENTNLSDAEIFEEILPEFYRFHAPAEIRISTDFRERKSFADRLSKREKRKIKTIVINENNRKITAGRAIERSRHEFEMKNLKPPVSAETLKTEIEKIFKLANAPAKIEAFDAAHISGTNPVAACVVWENGKFLADEYEFRHSDGMSELETLFESVKTRYSRKNDLPDLILIDGGASQLNTALKALENVRDRNFLVVSAVKPPGKHGEISHFLTETGERIAFESDSDAFRFLQTLRDEAHNAANSVHRTRRDYAHFYELASVLPSLSENSRREILKKMGSIKKLKASSLETLLEIFDARLAEAIFKDLLDFKKNGERKIEPLIVPIRYDDPNGDAQSLQPLASYKNQ